MNVTIVGSGNMARGIGTRIVAGGHRLTIFGRDTTKAKALADSFGVRSVEKFDEAFEADVVVLATPYAASLALATEWRAQLAGKILVDISNPLNATYDALATPPTTSAAETIQAAAPDARVVKAFNTTFASTLVAGSVSGLPLDVFLAGNDPTANDAIAAIVRDGGLVAVDTGPLQRARQLEGLAFLGITLQSSLGTGFATAWKLVHPPA
jgi:8-hydroxy-5-deazaflavin:NADPH oxidoreductase